MWFHAYWGWDTLIHRDWLPWMNSTVCTHVFTLAAATWWFRHAVSKSCLPFVSLSLYPHQLLTFATGTDQKWCFSMIFHMMGGMNIHLPAIWVFRVCTRLLTHSQMIPDAVGRALEVTIPTPVSMTRRIWICLFGLGCWAAWVAVWILGPTSSISMGFSIINHPAFGVPPWLWKPPKTSNVSARNHGLLRTHTCITTSSICSQVLQKIQEWCVLRPKWMRKGRLMSLLLAVNCGMFSWHSLDFLGISGHANGNFSLLEDPLANKHGNGKSTIFGWFSHFNDHLSRIFCCHVSFVAFGCLLWPSEARQVSVHDNHRFGQKQGVLAAEMLDAGASAVSCWMLLELKMPLFFKNGPRYEPWIWTDWDSWT